MKVQWFASVINVRYSKPTVTTKMNLDSGPYITKPSDQVGQTVLGAYGRVSTAIGQANHDDQISFSAQVATRGKYWYWP